MMNTTLENIAQIGDFKSASAALSGVLAEAVRQRLGLVAGSVTCSFEDLRKERNTLYGEALLSVGLTTTSSEAAESASDTAGCCPGIEEMRAALVSINAALDECLEVPANVLPAWNNVRAILRRWQDDVSDKSATPPPGV